jgi:hypothetical protein
VITHVYPLFGKKHITNRHADCWCEPDIESLGTDMGGKPARVFVHQVGVDKKLAQELLKSTRKNCWGGHGCT